jgi:hypothetical protein
MKITGMILGTVFALSAALTTPVYAEELSNEEMLRMVKALKDRVEQLERQLAEQSRKVDEVATASEHAQPGHVQAMSQRLQKLEQAKESGSHFGGVELYGVVEVEAMSGEDHTGVDGSDVTLATAELGLDFSVFNDWVNGTIVTLYEDDDTENWEVDQAYFTIGNTSEYPFYLTTGRMYVPFGNFETNLVSDPLTLEIGETRETAIELGFEKDNWYGSGYVFNGDVDEIGDDDIGNYGLNLGYAADVKDRSFDVGLSWINHIGDADGIEDAVGDTNTDGDAGPVRDYIPAWGLYGIYRLGPWSFIGEYVSATKDFTAAELVWKTGGARPSAYNLEVGYDFEIFGGRESNVAVAIQGTDESVVLGLPEHKFLAGMSMALYKNTSLALEYANAEDYSLADGGTGNDGDALTLQLAVDF